MKNRRKLTLAAALLALLLLAAGVSLAVLCRRISDADRENERLRLELEEKEKENDDLLDRLEKGAED